MKFIVLTLLKLASISKYWSPFCTTVTRAPGGTKLPSIEHLLMPASYPKAKAECIKPKIETDSRKKILELVLLDIRLIKKFKMNRK